MRRDPQLYVRIRRCSCHLLIHGNCRKLKLVLAHTVELAIVFLALTFDATVFVLTLVKTWRQARDSRKLGQSSVTHVIIRDGQYSNFVLKAQADAQHDCRMPQGLRTSCRYPLGPTGGRGEYHD